MRVKVSGLDLDSAHAYTPQAGEKLRALIEPILAQGDPVELDFTGVEHFSAIFFWTALGPLIEADSSHQLPALIRIENLSPLGENALESARALAVRRREVPGWASAMDRLGSQAVERE